ncbi:MAG: TRAP transporter small permease [Pseudomonadota bacterium]
MSVARAIVRYALGLLLLAMVILNVANAAGRYLFQKAIPGSDEILVFAMVWLVFLGAALVSLDRRHLGFDQLSGLLGARWRGQLIRGRYLCVALLSGYVTWQSWSVLQTLARVGQTSMASEIPMIVPHGAVPVGLGLICLISLVYAVRPTARTGSGSGVEDDPAAGPDGP